MDFNFFNHSQVIWACVEYSHLSFNAVTVFLYHYTTALRHSFGTTVTMFEIIKDSLAPGLWWLLKVGANVAWIWITFRLKTKRSIMFSFFLAQTGRTPIFRSLLNPFLYNASMSVSFFVCLDSFRFFSSIISCIIGLDFVCNLWPKGTVSYARTIISFDFCFVAFWLDRLYTDIYSSTCKMVPHIYFCMITGSFIIFYVNYIFVLIQCC